MTRWITTLSCAAIPAIAAVTIVLAADLRLDVPTPYSFLIAPPVALALAAGFLSIRERARSRIPVSAPEAPLRSSAAGTRRHHQAHVEGFVLFEASHSIPERRS